MYVTSYMSKRKCECVEYCISSTTITLFFLPTLTLKHCGCSRSYFAILQISLFMRARVALNFLGDETTKRYSNALIYYLGTTLYQILTHCQSVMTLVQSIIEALRAYVPSITLIPVYFFLTMLSIGLIFFN